VEFFQLDVKKGRSRLGSIRRVRCCLRVGRVRLKMTVIARGKGGSQRGELSTTTTDS